MKLMFIVGPSAVGKMTVAQELCKLTDFSLFTNHDAIELSIKVFGYYNPLVVSGIRDIVFRNFAVTNKYGLIFTYCHDFDRDMDEDYVDKIRSRFTCDTDFYFVELVAPLEVRLERNKTQNRLECKPSKRDVESSELRLLTDECVSRCESSPGEVTYDNYLRLDNSDISAREAAVRIKEYFML